jgi:predicted DNA-binding transcriptional regulator AlpA
MKLEADDFPPETIAAIAAAVADRLAPLLAAPPAADEIMDTKAAAAYLKLSRQRLEIWRSAGGGPQYVKTGRAVRYRKSDLDGFLSAATRSHTA